MQKISKKQPNGTRKKVLIALALPFLGIIIGLLANPYSWMVHNPYMGLFALGALTVPVGPFVAILCGVIYLVAWRSTGSSLRGLVIAAYVAGALLGLFYLLVVLSSSI